MPEQESEQTKTAETVIDTETSISEEGSGQFQSIKGQALEILAELPGILTRFFNKYRKPILTVGLILAFGVGIKVTLAVIDALNDIPLLAPTFELIGIVYTAWFVYRYLLRASNRQELWTEVKSLKEQLIGDKNE
jgi:glutamyl-tRNA synthetase